LIFDLIIIGAGPAGLSAAIHAKRFDLNCVVLERNSVGGQARAANWIENYPGFPGGISGRDLMSRFARQAETAGAKIKKCSVTRVGKKPDGAFELITSTGMLDSKTVIIATGLEAERWMMDDGQRMIYYYPVPDEIEHEGKNVLVIGGGDAAFDEAISFSNKASSITIAMRGNSPKALPSLVKRARSAGVCMVTGANEKDIAKMPADIIVACCGKRRNLDMIDKSLLVPSHRSLDTLQLAGDIAHPDIRHIAAAAGDGIKAVEKIIECR
jgi:thioredoxin reductase (NADPH)